MELLHDTYTWVIFSFAVFACAAWVFGRPVILKSLDAKIATIRAEVENAARLKTEAQGLLAEYEQRHRDASVEADRMIADAREQAEHVYHTEEQRLNDMMFRKEQQLVERIALIRDQAVAELRDTAARLAYDATETLVKSRMDDDTRARLLERSLDQIIKRTA
jgi:F-type H+-transporting ATPase subunit b